MPSSTSEHLLQVPADNQAGVVVRRHIFGLVVLYIEAMIGLLAALVLIYFLSSGFVDDSNRTRVFQVLGLLGVAAVILTVLMLLAATYIYSQNKLVITGADLTQVLQTGLLSRRISRLNLANIEDVTAVQSGLFPRLLNFGTLNVETAGEQENFHFIFCPEPDKYAKLILSNHKTALKAPG